MTTKEFANWFYAEEETPEPSDLLAKLEELHAVKLAHAVEKEIAKRHKLRGWTTGKRLWELKLLHLARLALGLPSKAPAAPGEPS
jgi:hypothetical protein